MAEDKPYRCGIVLGGGGTRGFAHLGVLKALEEKGIKPDIISGVSAGAIAGAFIANGISPEDTLNIMKSHRLFDFTTFQLPKTGLLNFDKLSAHLRKHLGDMNLEDTPIPFIVTTTDLLKGKVRYFKKGNLADIIQASASIPVLFSPVKLEDSYYVDGGVFSNTPIAPLLGLCEKIIVINISPLDSIETPGNIRDIAARTFQLSVNASNLLARDSCDLYIEPEGLANFPILDSSRADELYQIGYNYTAALEIDLFEKQNLWSKLGNFFKSE
ncbi:patatin-like phospholipase family protein [Robertkochia solimangrovi]|uniref:patatin-like phospholipase family protein n=1 Tax=Robertkochia solimangrovi TaxID=2213046 RepID=UPI001180FAAE|nr:patatin-like phospholipase family protein [Robertkochia solimangrovi]TRZ45334.1 patatin [Robertkochia solimangrovi]